MPTTTNKGYEVQATGSNTGTWGQVLNDQALSYIDQNLGGVTTLSLAATDVSLTASESRNAILRLTGTLSANVQVTTSCVGFFFVENATTGSFSVTITNGVSGVVVDRGARITLLSTAANGVRAISNEFGAGTTMLFLQTTPPTGWTKIVTVDNALIRLVSGSVTAGGGSNNFTTVNSSLFLERANLPNATITTSSAGAHSHTVSAPNTGSQTSDTNNDGQQPAGRATSTLTTSTASNHTHTIALNGGVTQTAVDLDIKYVDSVRAEKA